VTASELALPDGYRELREDLERSVAAARWRTQRIVNTELVTLYWQLGDSILRRQQAEGWGTRVIDRLATLNLHGTAGGSSTPADSDGRERPKRRGPKREPAAQRPGPAAAGHLGPDPSA